MRSFSLNTLPNKTILMANMDTLCCKTFSQNSFN
jgi:hypothetical protein